MVPFVVAWVLAPGEFAAAAARWQWTGYSCLPYRSEPSAFAITTLAGRDHRRLGPLRKALARDLEASGHFRIVPAPLSTAQLRLEGTRIRPRLWGASGVRWVLKLRLQRVGDREGVGGLLFRADRSVGTVLPVVPWKTRFFSSKRSTRATAHQLTDALLRRIVGMGALFASRIAYVEGHAKRSRVMVRDLDGGDPVQVSPSAHEAVLPSWSPDGSLAFTGYLWRNPDLFVVRGARRTRISKRAGLNTGAAFSPDGRSLVLTLSHEGNAELYLLAADGALRRRLTHHSRIDTSPTWSPDGEEVAFVSTRGGSPQIYVLPLNGGVPRQLTSVGSYNQEPAWCPLPGCPWIAFTHRTDEGAYRVMLVNATSGALKAWGPLGSRSPSWSSDGKLLLYATAKGLYALDRGRLCKPRRLLTGRLRTPRWSRALR